jgi:hypothetical protein
MHVLLLQPPAAPCCLLTCRLQLLPLLLPL